MTGNGNGILVFSQFDAYTYIRTRSWVVVTRDSGHFSREKLDAIAIGDKKGDSPVPSLLKMNGDTPFRLIRA